MLDNERIVLKENANLLANLLTENVPYLLANYLQNGVISENEREAIISASSAHDIKIKLLETLADKEEISLQSVMQGLEATENHCVSKEIESLLAGKSDNEQDQEVTDGSGDRLEDVNAYAINLVDDVIATAEETTSNQVSQEELEPVVLDDVGLTETEEVEPIDSGAEVDPAEENLVEASVEVHKVDTEPPQSEDEDESVDVVDKSVTFPERVATVIEDHKRVEVTDHHEEQPTADEDGDYRGHGLDARNESENEDDQIDIEKEFVMPTEPETNNNNDLASDHKQTPVLTRMVSNEIIMDDEDKPSSPISKEPVADGDGDGLDALMARKALVRQQVEKFEKTAPGGGKGKVQYSFRSSTQESEAKAAEEEGSKVKNLKNFFQRLSTSESNTPPPAGPAKSVGKLKVTFPS